MSLDKLGPRWLPLESNPDVINKYVNNIGVSTDLYEFIDIYGLDSELLSMVPRPVLAVLLLFPCTKIYQEYRSKKVEEVKQKGQNISQNVYFTKQTVSNACGTVAIIHSLANNKQLLKIDQEKPFGKFLKATESMSPEECAEYLKTDESITQAHLESAQEGQTEPPSHDETIDLHFIAFIQKDGSLYELDGVNEFPINHGFIKDDNLLESACEVVKKMILLNPNEVRFNLIGLVAKEE